MKIEKQANEHIIHRFHNSQRHLFFPAKWQGDRKEVSIMVRERANKFTYTMLHSQR